jgi:hypothetical protein
MRQLDAARASHRKIARACSVARGDGWTLLLFAVLSVICGLASVEGVMVGLALGVIAYFELRGAGQLKRLETRATRMLTINQLCLAGLLVSYASWQLFLIHTGQHEVSKSFTAQPELKDAMGSYVEVVGNMMVLFYQGLIAVAVLGQGSMALYYHTRARHLQAYLEATPPWIHDMQRAGLTI